MSKPENCQFIGGVRYSTIDIPDSQIIMRVDCEVIGHDRAILSCDTRYFITSLDSSDITPSDLQKTVRDHWQIENSLHFVKDRW